MKILITTSLNKKVCKGLNSFRMFSFKRLSKREVSLAKKLRIQRFYLPALYTEDSDKFLREFDMFWDKVVYRYGPEHPFWRNVVSSKMQPWENSIGYACLVLFALTRISDKEDAKLIVVCDSVEMKRVFVEWARINGWELIGQDVYNGDRGRTIYQRIINFGWFITRALSSLYKKWFSPNFIPENNSNDVPILISSFFYPHSFKNGSYNDPFFGTLHYFIRDNGLKSVYLCEPLNEFNKTIARNILQSKDVAVYITYSIIGWLEMISLLIKLYLRKIKIQQIKFMGCEMSGLIQWQSRNFSNSFNLTAELRFAATRKLCKTYRFNRLIYGFEENVHERACLQAFRESNSGKVIAYSHGVLYPLNLKIRLTDKESLLKPEPDVHICTGPYAKELLKKIGVRYSSSKLKDGCIIKDIPVIEKEKKRLRDDRKILVALDGMDSTVILLEWILEHTRALNNFNFYIRFHPNVPVRRILSQCINDFPDNVKISNMDIMQDIESSFCVFYRHSSVGMQAILNGVPAVYLAVDSPLSGDPLEALSTYKWTVSSLSELISVIEEIKFLSQNQRDNLLGSAERFVREYFAAPVESSLISFIN